MTQASKGPIYIWLFVYKKKNTSKAMEFSSLEYLGKQLVFNSHPQKLDNWWSLVKAKGIFPTIPWITIGVILQEQ